MGYVQGLKEILSFRAGAISWLWSNAKSVTGSGSVSWSETGSSCEGKRPELAASWGLAAAPRIDGMVAVRKSLWRE